MYPRYSKMIVIAIIIVAVIGVAVVCSNYFSGDHNNDSDSNARYYNEGDQIRSTVKWQDDSDIWHTGKYVFTVIDRGSHSLRADVTYTEGAYSLSQNIVVTETNSKIVATIEKFDNKIELEPTNGKYVYQDIYEITDPDLVSRVFELACNTFISCVDGNVKIDPKDLFNDPSDIQEIILLDVRAMDGIFQLSQALYKDGQLHRSTIISSSNIVCSEDPDLVKNFIGEGTCIEHIDYKMAGTTWDCLKVTTEYGDNTKWIRYYTVDGFLLLKSQMGFTTTHNLDSISI